MTPGERFTKTWRVRSSGCETWSTGSTWAFVSGDQMSAPDSVSVPDTPLGSTIDISVEMVAPDADGSYQGYWQMQSPAGVLSTIQKCTIFNEVKVYHLMLHLVSL